MRRTATPSALTMLRRSCLRLRGNPMALGASITGAGCIPRMHGGTADPDALLCHMTGLSPCARGNRHDALRERPRRGSIPVCTGEPLSRPGSGFRSIPVCTGEPRSAPSSGATSTVYPRVHGGTTNSNIGRPIVRGLSPRARGNPSQAVQWGVAEWSIPACTGEPNLADAATARETGLSPRARGNPHAEARADAGAGSIPACTGEPRCGRRRARLDGVYPRVHGGTLVAEERRAGPGGLSPRARGNLRPRGRQARRRRSIPACTGEPWPASLQE